MANASDSLEKRAFVTLMERNPTVKSALEVALQDARESAAAMITSVQSVRADLTSSPLSEAASPLLMTRASLESLAETINAAAQSARASVQSSPSGSPSPSPSPSVEPSGLPKLTTADLVVALSGISEDAWSMLKGYTMNFMSTWGTASLASVFTEQGGLVVRRTVKEALYGVPDPVLYMSAASSYPTDYAKRPWLYTPQLAESMSSRSYFQELLAPELTGTEEAEEWVPSWNPNKIGTYHPYVQQKTMLTGNGNDNPQWVTRYRGLPFTLGTYGAINMTGVAEGTVMDSYADEDGSPQYVFDSILRIPLEVIQTDNEGKIGALNLRELRLTENSIAACDDATKQAASAWAGLAMFYYALSTLENPSADIYEIAEDDGTLRNFFSYNNIAALPSELDVFGDRCRYPEINRATWDRQSIYSAPVFITLPMFQDASETMMNKTAKSAATWRAEVQAAGNQWKIMVDPSSGFGVVGQRGYQYNNEISRTTWLFPNFWLPKEADGVTEQSSILMPSHYTYISWEPLSGDRKSLASVAMARTALYYTLVCVFPPVCWLLACLAVISLRFSTKARRRRKGLEWVQASRAPLTRIPKREQEMAEKLARMADGDDDDDSIPSRITEEEESGRTSSKPRHSSGDSGLTIPETSEGPLQDPAGQPTRRVKKKKPGTELFAMELGRLSSDGDSDSETGIPAQHEA